MQSAQKSFDHTFGNDFQSTQLRHLYRIEQVKAGTTLGQGRVGTIHSVGNVSGRNR